MSILIVFIQAMKTKTANCVCFGLPVDKHCASIDPTLVDEVHTLREIDGPGGQEEALLHVSV